MILLLDVSSPIPEFHLINDKKIIYSIKIIEDASQKLSDSIIPTYLEINNIYNLNDNLSNLVLTIGPGSYTALRVGASFIAGLNQSMNLSTALISTETLYEYLFNKDKCIGVYFESSNNQKFLSYKKKLLFFHEKIEDEDYILPKSISHIFSNVKNPRLFYKNISIESFSIKDVVLKNLNNLDFNKNIIIKPIYISNNILLN